MKSRVLKAPTQICILSLKVELSSFLWRGPFSKFFKEIPKQELILKSFIALWPVRSTIDLLRDLINICWEFFFRILDKFGVHATIIFCLHNQCLVDVGWYFLLMSSVHFSLAHCPHQPADTIHGCRFASLWRS